MTDIPREAVEALSRELVSFASEGPAELYHEIAEDMLRKVEEVWPHNPPGRDHASTTASSTTLDYRPSGRKYIGFGRGPMEVKA